MAETPKGPGLIIALGRKANEPPDDDVDDKMEGLKAAIQDFWRAENNHDPDIGVAALRAFVKMVMREDDDESE